VSPLEGCRHNVIRDNTIVDSGSRTDHGIPFHAGASIALVNQTGQEGRLEHALVEGNRISGAVGLAVDIFGAGHYAVVLEGDGNRVAFISASDEVLDLGSGNRVTGPK
jgi:hypothetical protein